MLCLPIDDLYISTKIERYAMVDEVKPALHQTFEHTFEHSMHVLDWYALGKLNVVGKHIFLQKEADTIQFDAMH